MQIANRESFAVASRRLPYDAEVEYIKSDGRATIDTGLTQYEIGRLALRCMYEQFVQNGYILRSAATIGDSEQLTRAMLGYSNSLFNWRSSNTILVPQLQPHVQYGIEMAASGMVANGVSAVFGSTDGTYAPGNVVLFSASAAGNLRDIGCRAYALRMWDNNGALMRDMIPVRVGTVGGMYDRVKRRMYYNAASAGAFTLGRDRVYTAVEYIESTGAQWLDTGIDLASGDTFTINVVGSFTATTDNQFFGMYASSYFGIGSGARWSVAGNTTSTAAADTSLHTFVLGSSIGNSRVSTLMVDGASYTHTRNNAAGRIGILALGTGQFPSSFRLRYASVVKNGMLVRDMSPVSVGGIGYMHDAISDQLIGNAGTGAFVVGPDIN